MAPTSAPTATAPPDDPVRAALADPATEPALFAQALSRLNRWLADLPLERRRQEAQDVVDQACLRALEKGRSFDPALGDVGAWLHGLLANVIREHCRKLRKLPAQPPADGAGWDHLEGRLTRGDAARAAALLDRLTLDERNLVEWHYYDDLSFRHIGERLKISEGTARQRVHRTLAKLRRSVQAERSEDLR
jgi:RNA polymerase sigma-70 factor (ECF subfamily)